MDVAERRAVPVPDRDSAPYWGALAHGRLELQHCRDCGHWTWPARAICSGCHGENLAWEPVNGTGEVHSWVITHQIYAPDFVDLVPYTVVLVRLDEQDDILIPGRLLSDVKETQRSAGETPGGSAERSRPEVKVSQGLRVRAAPEKITDEVGQLHWEVDT